MRWLLFALATFGCQKPAASEPVAPPPAPVPEPEPAPVPAKLELVDASAAPVVEAATDAGADARAEPTCAPMAKAPTYDATLRYSTRTGAPGSGMAGITLLIATVSIPALKVSREVWDSPAPTSCSARAEGEEMSIHCITDEGTLTGRVRIAGEELVVEVGHGLPPGAALVPGKPEPPPPPRLEPLLTVKVPCGARLRVQTSKRDYL